VAGSALVASGWLIAGSGRSAPLAAAMDQATVLHPLATVPPPAPQPGGTGAGPLATRRHPRYIVPTGARRGGDMAYRKSFMIRWSECDANGHLRNTAYSELGIETRLAFLTEKGFPWSRFVEDGIGPVIQREEIDYFHELHLGDAVELDVKALGGSPEGGRFKLSHDFYKPGGKHVARIVLRGGWLDLRRRKLTQPPDDLRRALDSLERGEPFEELPPIKGHEARDPARGG
jgi:acyl-CoA thioester hydrolase